MKKLILAAFVVFMAAPPVFADQYVKTKVHMDAVTFGKDTPRRVRGQSIPAPDCHDRHLDPSV